MHPLEQQLLESWPTSRRTGARCLVAVSGGADSVALLRALRATGEPQGLLVGHFNHGLRAESEHEQQFVTELCRQLEVECRVGRGSLDEHSAPDGLEAAAREARYRFLQGQSEAAGARYVVTAHTADDQVETVLHRIVRGTGLAGLAGIPRARSLGPGVSLLRPMLQVTRGEVLAYLQDLDQPYCEDASNRDPRFTRNRIRHELLPLLRELNPAVDEAVTRLAALADEADTVIERLVGQLAERCVERVGGVVKIDRAELRQQPDYVVRQLLLSVWTESGWPRQAMGFQQWQRMAEMATGGGEAMWTFPGNVRATVTDGMLRLDPQPATGGGA